MTDTNSVQEHMQRHEFVANLIKKVEKLQKERPKLIKKWFTQGQLSAKRKNKSGCCCIINDNDEIESLCGAHEDYVQELKDLMREVSLADWFVQNNDDFNKRWKKALGDNIC
jgi:hypothetical protein